MRWMSKASDTADRGSGVFADLLAEIFFGIVTGAPMAIETTQDGA